MIRKIEEHGKLVAIVGFKDVHVENVEELFNTARQRLKNVTFQFFNARLIAGWEHLYFASLNALTAFKNRLNISNNLAVEILLYASAQRQIRHAVELLGIKAETSEVAAVVLADKEEDAANAIEEIARLLHGERDDTVLELTDDKFKTVKELFGVSDTELNAKLERKGLEKETLKDLIIERVALLVTQR